MATIAEEVCAQLDSRLNAAEAAVGADSGASTALAGVFAEFRRKFAKTRSAVETVQGPGQREAVVELEQAADSTKWAALADKGASERTKLAVVSAHDSICGSKQPVLSLIASMRNRTIHLPDRLASVPQPTTRWSDDCKGSRVFAASACDRSWPWTVPAHALGRHRTVFHSPAPSCPRTG